MKKIVISIAVLVLAVVLILICTKRRPLVEGKCKLTFKAVKKRETILIFASQRCNPLDISEKPSELKDLPVGVPENVTYYVADLGDKNIPLVVDYSRKFRLYLDTDGDGQLSDEKSVIAKSIRESWFGRVEYYRFGPICVEFGHTENKVKTKFYVEAYNRAGSLTFYPAGYRIGKIQLSKKIYKVAVVDGNFDGRYDRILSTPVENYLNPACDSFAIDLNGDDRLDWAYFLQSELMPLSSMVRIGDAYYDIDITSEATALELRRVEPEFGTLAPGGADIKLTLWSDNAVQYLSGSNEKWQLPTGRYAAMSIIIHHTDSLQNKWTLIGNGKTGELSDFEVRKAEEVSFNIGPPFLVKADVTRRDKEVSISCYLEGQAGEQYRPLVRKNGQQQPAPKFKIMDEAGKVLDSGIFEYG